MSAASSVSFFTFPFFAGSFASVYRVVAAAGQQHPAAGVLATAGMAALLAVRVWRVVASTER